MPTIKIQDTQLFYAIQGTGRPCLVMHGGLGLDHTYLRGLDSLGDGLQLVYYDHRHNGRSGRPPVESVTHAQLAADAEALRQQLASSVRKNGVVRAMDLAVLEPDGERSQHSTTQRFLESQFQSRTA